MMGLTLMRQVRDQKEDEEQQQEQMIENQRRQFQQNQSDYRQGIVNPAALP